MKRRFLPGSRTVILVGALGALATLGADCEGDIAQDPTFRDWCGSGLCSWHLDAGNIRRVSTWTENDFGVALVDTPTQLSQVTEESSATCLLFTSVADIDPTAQVSLLVDFNDDGSIDKTSQLDSSQWHKVQAEITAPPSYNRIRFLIRKDGTGAAVLAEMRIQSTTGCSASQAPALTNLKIGEKCASGMECASGVCPATGAHVCAQCSDQAPCASGVPCTATSPFFPAQCGPGQGLGASGDPCIANGDCRSGTCQAATALSLVADGGACDLNQPPTADNCSWYLVVGGTCL